MIITQTNEEVTATFPSMNKLNSLQAYKDEYEATHRATKLKCLIVKKVTCENWTEWKNITQKLLTDNELWKGVGGTIVDDELIKKFNNGKNVETCWEYLNLLETISPEQRQELKNAQRTEVTEVTFKDETIYINSEGYDYARYVGWKFL